MKEFKAGDKVKVSNVEDPAMGRLVGRVGVVALIYPSPNAPFPIYVTFDESDYEVPFTRDEVDVVSLQLGDKVKIRTTSEFYKDGSDNNPVDVVGNVTSTYGTGAGCDLPIDVKWPDIPVVNDYAESDLVYVV